MAGLPVFDFSNFYQHHDDDRGFYLVTGFLVDVMRAHDDALAFFSLCQYVGQTHVNFAAFLTSLQLDLPRVTVVPVVTDQDLALCYQQYLPQLS
jgi:hypothetical protein